MSFYKFQRDDISINTLKTHPEFEVIIAAGTYYINNRTEHSASKNFERGVPQGFVSLYELNINRTFNTGTGDKPWQSAGSIFPFITKDSTRTAFKTIGTSNYNDSSQFGFGSVVKSKYPLSASFSKIYVASGGTMNDDVLVTNKKFIYALENVLNESSYLSPHYQYSSDFGNKATQELSIVTIPSIFYGSEIEPGSVELNFYLTGALSAKLQDIRRNGELIETTGSNVGKVAGVVLYREGFFVLTGSWDIKTNHKEFYAESLQTPKWKHFGLGLPTTGEEDIGADGVGGHGGEAEDAILSSFSFKFRGTNKIPVLTMLAHAKKKELNYSNNPTFVEKNTRILDEFVWKMNCIENHTYNENDKKIKNTVNSNIANYSAPFDKITYISKIGIYDEDENLLGVAKLATPIKKTEERDFTFKLKLDF